MITTLSYALLDVRLRLMESILLQVGLLKGFHIQAMEYVRTNVLTGSLQETQITCV